MTTRQKVATKYVNVLDRVIDVQRTLVPATFGITRVDRPDPDPVYARTHRPSNAWLEFDDLTLGDLVKTGLLGE